MTIQRIRLSAAGAILIAAGWLTTVAVHGQESGTLLSQTLTAQRVGTDPVFDFEVASPKGANSTTKIILEIGPDGNTTIPPPDPSLPNTVKFTISKGGGGTKDFTPAGGTDNVTFPQKIVVLNKGLESPTAPGLYALAIAHLGNGVTSTESWKLQITGLPSAFRVNASIDQGTFKTLAPTGAAGVGCPNGQICQTPTPPVCPRGECATCGPCVAICIPCVTKWIYYVPFPVIPECPGCPGVWKTPIRDGYERAVVSMTPADNSGVAIGPGKADQVRVNIRGGEAIGGVVDVGHGDYVQMIEHRVGESPTVSATAGSVTTPDIVVASMTGGFGLREYLIGALLALVFAVIGYVVRGMLGGGNVARG